ncbi:18.6 kDa class III heat shock protein [Dichanthelium oligosanthes]|uniref:18.6 kDa class III heat shock protein n=1 Tax=Dichanthelium oligosanthes TaxID=888268 RepID=A0A1E5WBK2_9POAL|nr:18.6 kDa class III heat shock protein [Dichanthelium oligosanthes]
MTELFDTTLNSLLHLPEVLDRLAAADGDRRSGSHHGAHQHGHARVHGLGGGSGGGGGAPVDIVETPGEYAFLLDVPGLSKADIQVTLEEDRVLVMKGGNNNGKRKREEEEEGEGCRYIRLERRAAPRSFVRKFRLPEDADTGGIAARCENGVLTVTVKKQPPPEKKTKSVQVTIA